MEKKLFLNFCFVLLLVINLNAQSTKPNNTNVLWKLSDKTDNSLLWEISGNGLKNSCYLVFTTANLCQTSEVLLKKLINKRSNINLYYTETGIRNPNFKGKIEKLSLLTDTLQTINKLLDNNYYLKFKAKAAKLQVKEREFLRYQLAGLSNLILSDTVLKCNHPNMTEAVIRMYNEQYKLFPINELLSIEEMVENLTAYGNNYYIYLIKYLLDNEDIVQQAIILKAKYYEDENLLEIKKLYDKHKFLNSKFDNPELFNTQIDRLIVEFHNVVDVG